MFGDIYGYIYFCAILTNNHTIMKKLILSCLGVMLLGGIALGFQSNSDLVSLVGVQDAVAITTEASSETCTRCWGSGKCTTCRGKGYVVGAVKRKCSDCNGTGVCQRCKGTGKLDK